MSRKWQGFDGRQFLTDEEYSTYLRRPPVRYSARDAPPKPDCCSVCGKPFSDENPAQVAHRIPFGRGLRRFRLTPEWLDRSDNLVWAHRGKCNKMAELSDDEIFDLLEVDR